MQTDSEPEVTAGDVLAAQARLRRWIEPTPLHHADRFGCWLKLENLQRTGAYKVRGALNALLAAAERGDRRGVIAASAGNHAQGMAWAARRIGLPCIAVMPVHVPRTKLAGVARLGAKVILHGDSFDQAQDHAQALATAQGLRYLHPFDDPDVIAGQGTVGLELAAFAPDVVLVPIGGGGLASGVALALHAQGVRIVGVQVKGVHAMAQVLNGEVPTEPLLTLAEGTRVQAPGQITRRLLARLLDDLVIVDESDVCSTLVQLAMRERIVAEGAGALALSAVRRVAGRRKCAIVSGGNIDARVLAKLLANAPAPRGPRLRPAPASVFAGA